MKAKIPDITRIQKAAFGAGIIGLAACGVGICLNRHALAISYLWSFLFWFGLALGCLNAAMIHYLAGGRWGELTRRFFEAGYMTLPILLLLCVPILLNLPQLYPWATSQGLSDPFVEKRAHYENIPGFILRALVFFAVWIFIAVRLRKWSLKQDATKDSRPTEHLQSISGPGLVIVNLIATFAFVDWVMSTEFAWFSTLFAVVLLAGDMVLALAFCIALTSRFFIIPEFQALGSSRHFRDMGSLLLAFVMFWTYVAFSQFLVIYSGNQPSEIGWCLHRIGGSWKWLLGFIALFHFFVPFFILLFRAVKENVRRLAIISVLLFFVHVFETFWVVVPTFYPPGIRMHWTDFTAWLGIGGIWVAVFLGQLKKHPLLARVVSVKTISGGAPLHAR